MDSVNGRNTDNATDTPRQPQPCRRAARKGRHRPAPFLQELVKVLADAADFISVPQIHWRLEQQGVKSSVGAVYRNVKRLEAQGRVEQRRFQGRKGVFALASQSAPRDHLIVVDTGEVESLQGETLERLRQEIARAKGVDPASCHIEFYVNPNIGDGDCGGHALPGG